MDPMMLWKECQAPAPSKKCQHCKKKPSLLKCKDCSAMFCSNCIQLEIHACPQMAARKQALISNLESKLVKVVAPKLSKI